MVEALIIIDMLEGYMKDTDQPKKIIQNIVGLVKSFKRKKRKVILTTPDFSYKNQVMLKLWGKEFENNPKGKKIVKELARFKFDKIIKKPEYSAFFKTDLEKYCKINKIDKIFFSGVFSGCCVYFTAVDAAYRGIQPVLIKDAAGGPRKDLVDKS